MTETVQSNNSNNNLFCLNSNRNNNYCIPSNLLYKTIFKKDDEIVKTFNSFSFANPLLEEQYNEYLFERNKLSFIIFFSLAVISYVIAIIFSFITYNGIGYLISLIVLCIINIILKIIYIFCSTPKSRNIISIFVLIFWMLIVSLQILMISSTNEVETRKEDLVRSFLKLLAGSLIIHAMILKPKRIVMYVVGITQISFLFYISLSKLKGEKNNLILDGLAQILCFVVPEFKRKYEENTRIVFLQTIKINKLCNYYEDFIQYFNTQKISFVNTVNYEEEEIKKEEKEKEQNNSNNDAKTEVELFKSTREEKDKEKENIQHKNSDSSSSSSNNHQSFLQSKETFKNYLKNNILDDDLEEVETTTNLLFSNYGKLNRSASIKSNYSKNIAQINNSFIKVISKWVNFNKENIKDDLEKLLIKNKKKIFKIFIRRESIKEIRERESLKFDKKITNNDEFEKQLRKIKSSRNKKEEEFMGMFDERKIFLLSFFDECLEKLINKSDSLQRNNTGVERNNPTMNLENQNNFNYNKENKEANLEENSEDFLKILIFISNQYFKNLIKIKGDDYVDSDLQNWKSSVMIKENLYTILQNKVKVINKLETTNMIHQKILSNEGSPGVIREMENSSSCNNEDKDEKKEKKENEKNDSSYFQIFQKLGTFALLLDPFTQTLQYFEISFGKFQLNNGKYIIDILINDITDLKSAERGFAEGKLKHKVLSKIAHEFKTPVIMTINILSEIYDKIEENDITNVSELCLRTIKFSEYLTFLIHDVIFYASDVKIKIKEQKNADIIEVIEFCFSVLQSLLSLYSKPVIPILEWDVEELKKYSITTDSFRLKQVLLNFISNAIKFTKKGNIVLKCQIEDYGIKSDNNRDKVKREHLSPDRSFSNKNKSNIILGVLPLPEDEETTINKSSKVLKTISRKNTLMKNIKSNRQKNLIISLSDTGQGMKEDHIMKIINESKENENLKINIDKDYNRGGTGLGIGICKSIIDKLSHHEMMISSKEKEGTEIIIKIKHIEANSLEENEKENNDEINDVNENENEEEVNKFTKSSFNHSSQSQSQNNFGSEKTDKDKKSTQGSFITRQLEKKENEVKRTLKKSLTITNNSKNEVNLEKLNLMSKKIFTSVEKKRNYYENKQGSSKEKNLTTIFKKRHCKLIKKLTVNYDDSLLMSDKFLEKVDKGGAMNIDLLQAENNATNCIIVKKKSNKFKEKKENENSNDYRLRRKSKQEKYISIHNEINEIKEEEMSKCNTSSCNESSMVKKKATEDFIYSNISSNTSALKSKSLIKSKSKSKKSNNLFNFEEKNDKTQTTFNSVSSLSESATKSIQNLSRSSFNEKIRTSISPKNKKVSQSFSKMKSRLSNIIVNIFEEDEDKQKEKNSSKINFKFNTNDLNTEKEKITYINATDTLGKYVNGPVSPIIQAPDSDEELEIKKKESNEITNKKSTPTPLRESINILQNINKNRKTSDVIPKSSVFTFDVKEVKESTESSEDEIKKVLIKSKISSNRRKEKPIMSKQFQSAKSLVMLNDLQNKHSLFKTNENEKEKEKEKEKESFLNESVREKKCEFCGNSAKKKSGQKTNIEYNNIITNNNINNFTFVCTHNSNEAINKLKNSNLKYLEEETDLNNNDFNNDSTKSIQENILTNMNENCNFNLLQVIKNTSINNQPRKISGNSKSGKVLINLPKKEDKVVSSILKSTKLKNKTLLKTNILNENEKEKKINEIISPLSIYKKTSKSLKNSPYKKQEKEYFDYQGEEVITEEKKECNHLISCQKCKKGIITFIEQNSELNTSNLNLNHNTNECNKSGNPTINYLLNNLELLNTNKSKASFSRITASRRQSISFDTKKLFYSPSETFTLLGCKSKSLGVIKSHISSNINENFLSNKPKILVVEDTENIRKAMVNLFKKLKREKFNIIECEDGINCLNEIIKDTNEGSSMVRLVLIDENMNWFQGSETIKMIKKWENDHKIHRIITVSASAFLDSQNQSIIKNAGVDLLLPKPITKENIVQIFRKFPELEAE